MRDEKVKVLKAIPAIEPKNADSRTVCRGYLDEKGVAPNVAGGDAQGGAATGDQVVAVGRGSVLHPGGKRISPLPLRR